LFRGVGSIGFGVAAADPVGAGAFGIGPGREGLDLSTGAAVLGAFRGVGSFVLFVLLFEFAGSVGVGGGCGGGHGGLGVG